MIRSLYFDFHSFVWKLILHIRLFSELPNDTDEMLICDGCDLEMHVSCAGLLAVPTCDWLCPCCLEVLDARRQHLTGGGETRSLEARLPQLPALDADTLGLAAHAQQRFISDITARKVRAVEQLAENQRILGIESTKRIETLKKEIVQAKTDDLIKTQHYNAAARGIRCRLKLVDWKIADNFGTSTIQYRKDDGNVVVLRRSMTHAFVGGRLRSSYSYEGGTQHQWQSWYNKLLQYTRETRALPQSEEKNDAKERVASLQEELESSEASERERPAMDEDDRRNLMLSFATLLSEPQLDFEKPKEYEARKGRNPLFLGVVKTQDHSDVQVLNLLKEPTELVVIVPVGSVASASYGDVDVRTIEVGVEYYLFGSIELFRVIAMTVSQWTLVQPQFAVHREISLPCFFVMPVIAVFKSLRHLFPPAYAFEVAEQMKLLVK